MPRIRTIKPEFWDSPGTGRASLRARLFFIALWNYADDWGVGDGHPGRLLSFAFPNDETSDVEPRNFRRLASEVAECFDVQWYEVDGRPYYAIPSWELHQRTEKKAKRKNPPPDQAFSYLYDSASENPPHNRGNRHEGKGKGEEGKGKKEEHSSSPAASVSVTEHFERAYQSWPKKVEKKKSLDKFRQLAKKHDPEWLAGEITRFGTAYANTTEKRYVPALVVWLNGERWTDEPPTATTETVNAQWAQAISEVGKSCAATNHIWLSDGTCMHCTARRPE